MKLMSFSPWKLFVKGKRFIGSEEKPESSVQMNLQRSCDMMNIACKKFQSWFTNLRKFHLDTHPFPNISHYVPGLS